MRRMQARVLAVIVMCAGAVFALQGLRVLPSAVMYGKPEWIAIGVSMVIASALALRWIGSRPG